MSGAADPQQIVVDQSIEWRCRCPIRPLLARFGLVGGVHIHVSGRRSYALNYIVNVREAGMIAHCPACHKWRELYWDTERETVAERAWDGFVPSIGCSCEQ